jgi:hypothetical protein
VEFRWDSVAGQRASLSLGVFFLGWLSYAAVQLASRTIWKCVRGRHSEFHIQLRSARSNSLYTYSQKLSTLWCVIVGLDSAESDRERRFYRTYSTFSRPTGRRSLCKIRSPSSLIGKYYANTALFKMATLSIRRLLVFLFSN